MEIERTQEKLKQNNKESFFNTQILPKMTDRECSKTTKLGRKYFLSEKTSSEVMLAGMCFNFLKSLVGCWFFLVFLTKLNISQH